MGRSIQALNPAEGAYYDDVILVDLSKVEPMIALPFHPSNAFTIADFKANMMDILHQVDKATIEQFKLKEAPESLTKKVRGRQVLCGSSGHRRLFRRYLSELDAGLLRFCPVSGWETALCG